MFLGIREDYWFLLMNKFLQGNLKRQSYQWDYRLSLPIELNLRKCKWLLLPIYRPPFQNENHFVSQIQRIIDGYIKTIPNLLIFGDFNLDTSNAKLSSLIENNGLYSMIKTPTCFGRQMHQDACNHRKADAST